MFVLAGSIVEGIVKPGMSVRIKVNSSSSCTLRIHSIEYLRHAGGTEDICLCIKYPENDEIGLGFLEELNLDNETLEIE